MQQNNLIWLPVVMNSFKVKNHKSYVKFEFFGQGLKTIRNLLDIWNRKKIIVFPYKMIRTYY